MRVLQFYLSLLDTEEEKSKFEKLYNEYRQLLKYKALQILKNEALSEEAVHDAFIRVTSNMEKISEFPSHNTKGFLVVITKNVCLDILKKENRLKIVDIEKAPPKKVSFDEDFNAVETEYLIEKLSLLSDASKDVLQLKIYHDLSNKEIAKTLSISEAAVRKRFQRAREALKELLEVKE